MPYNPAARNPFHLQVNTVLKTRLKNTDGPILKMRLPASKLHYLNHVFGYLQTI
jgi:hypothetical protein